jgi:hypothetical protein
MTFISMRADTFGQRFTNLTNTDKCASVITQQQEDSMNQKEYNALLHAIWLVERKILELVDSGLTLEDNTIQKLQRDREALSGLFTRL